MQNNIGLWLTKRAHMSPEREAYVDGNLDVRLTFDQLNRRANRCANAFLRARIEKGERVGLLIMNSAEFMEAYFALGKIGAVVVPLNWRLVADELEFILKDSGTTRLVYGEEFLDVVADLQSRGNRTDIHQYLQVVGDQDVAFFAESYQDFCNAASDVEPEIAAADDDMLYIMYTSGTTGLPKGVVHTHNTSVWGAVTIAATTYYREAERYLSPLPMFHVGALTPLTVNVYRGSTSIVMRNFDPALTWALIERERVTVGLAVPAMLNSMLQVPDFERYDRSSWRWCWSGAAPVPESMIQQYADLGVEIHQIYGLTESCGPACLLDAENALKKIGSAGKAFFHTDVRVVDQAGAECAPGESGEILVRGAHVMREYWNQPEATAETIVDGWLHTGDIATVDEEGFIYVQDRIKDMIISGGENVYPAEIENLLQTHPDISEAAVIGQPSERWGESPFAIVVRTDNPDNSLSEADVMEYCVGRLAGFKQPKGACFVDEIPRNPSGKILKRILREQFPGPAPV
ncbi:MAG: long-chain fatty acid--CoA ligase [Gammaproteobacteria bacterium]|nr:long-chain fatty acid--CoA ligase [Gammaproteobacteria bacterium]